MINATPRSESGRLMERIGLIGYETFGPFEVPKSKAPNGQRTLVLQARRIRNFWMEVDSRVVGLSEARGCYIFAIRAGKGITPWYVGQSTTGFKNECFQPQKREAYQNAYNEVRKGTPVLVLVARLTTGGMLSKAILGEQEANFVETQLILRAWSANRRLKNVSGLGLARRLKVPGMLNSGPGAPSDGAQLLRRTLGIRRE